MKYKLKPASDTEMEIPRAMDRVRSGQSFLAYKTSNDIALLCKLSSTGCSTVKWGFVYLNQPHTSPKFVGATPEESYAMSAHHNGFSKKPRGALKREVFLFDTFNDVMEYWKPTKIKVSPKSSLTTEQKAGIDALIDKVKEMDDNGLNDVAYDIVKACSVAVLRGERCKSHVMGVLEKLADAEEEDDFE